MERQGELTIFEQFTNFMERETRAAQIVIYGIPAIGLSIALYKIRPFAKFEKPSDIPSHFILNKTPLRGTVKRIEPSHGTLLMVNHKPLIPLPRLREKKCLPVKIAGVNVTGHGVSWLQTIVADKNIECIPLSKQKEHVNCIVKLTLSDQECLQIGEELVKLGFATCALPSRSSKDTDNLGYEKALIRAEKLARRRRNGYWHFARYPSYLWRMQMFFMEKLKSTMPVFITKHLNI